MRDIIRDFIYMFIMTTFIIFIWRVSSVAEWYVKESIIKKAEQEHIREFFMDWGDE